MASRYIKKLTDISQEDINLAGGKGTALAELKQSGFNVPDAFVITTKAFTDTLEQADITPDINAQLANVNYDDINSVENASRIIRDLISTVEISSELAREVSGAYTELGAGRVAVRSSATAEDSLEASWAGELESFLNVTEVSLYEAVIKCWASLYTPRAIVYRKEKDFLDKKIGLAVVVQTMIESEVSGICFTVHPVTEDKEQMIIEAGWGLGEAIVSGSITPDGYVVNKPDNSGTPGWKIVDVNLAQQEKQLVYDELEATAWERVSKEKQGMQKLDKGNIITLAEICASVENHFGVPQDIEWALKNGQFYIIQSRPITTLGESVGEPKALTKLDKYAYEREVSNPALPLIYLDSIYRSYIDNPFFDKYKIVSRPRPIAVLDRNYEEWQDVSQKIIINNRPMLNEIMDLSLGVVRENKEFFEKFLAQDLSDFTPENLATRLKKIDMISHQIYSLYIFFIDECFTTEDTELLKRLPQARREVGEFVDLIWQSFDKMLNAVARNHEINLRVIERSTLEEILALLSGELDVHIIKKHRHRPVAIITEEDDLNILYFQEALEVKRYLERNDPKEKKREEVKKSGLISGRPAYEGRVCGRVIKITKDEYDKYNSLLWGQENYILVTTMTYPEIVPYLSKAAAIITDEGGITCHAVIVARELKKPCVVGTGISTQVLKTGDMVEVDGASGIVKLLKDMDDNNSKIQAPNSR